MTATLVIHRHKNKARFYTETLSKFVNLEMVSIPSGEFIMGSSLDEENSRDSERPQHLVKVPAFFMGKYPITQAQYEAVMGTNPSRFKDKPDSPSRPVEQVSWEDAQAFCQKLSELTGREYRLPSEAQWEYACRAKSSIPLPPVSARLISANYVRISSVVPREEENHSNVNLLSQFTEDTTPLPEGEKGKIYPPFHFGETISTKVANYNGEYVYGMGEKGEYREETTAVGSFKVANEFGLYDMHGNVWEWCEDDWHDNYKGAPTDGSVWMDAKSKESNKNRHPLRGGSWFNVPRYCRSACRLNDLLDGRADTIGFRVISFAPGLT
ncbi:MAG: formylglycine-generating enzyme family protein [Pseudanabaenaceae cyanobacterium bins.39]|nr:formylglycine-generating enzyme family protein [Pseudanabaenaceae cyanobacterium bins.39]